jgi:zinc transporter 5/7
LADPITSLIISLLILFTTVNLLRDTSKILLFQLPSYGTKIHEGINSQVKEIFT